MVNTVSEVIGWIGTAMYIGAYLFLTLGKLSVDRTLYHFINILGAVGLMINAFHYGNYPSVFVNVAWLAIALLAVMMILRKRRVHSGEAVE